jgi:hypothetical protein
MINNEKCYITRDEDDDMIWVWRKPAIGHWSPTNICGKEFVNFQRPDRSLKNTSAYAASDFKKKFGITIRQKTRKCVHLPAVLLDSEKYKIHDS